MQRAHPVAEVVAHCRQYTLHDQVSYTYLPKTLLTNDRAKSIAQGVPAPADLGSKDVLYTVEPRVTSLRQGYYTHIC